jgi:Mrp family chromosome partitioning ATPase
MIENTSRRNERDWLIARRRGVAPSQHLRPHFVALARQVCQWEKTHRDWQPENGVALGITSLTKAAGKSTVSFNLCSALTTVTRSRVLLVESDFGRPFIARRLGRSKTPGLSEILSGDAALGEAILDTPLTDLSVLDCGQTNGQKALELPFDLLPAVIDEQLADFSYVVFDLPVANTLTACHSMTPYLDGVILAVDSSQLDQQGIERFRQQLESQGTEIIGVVINKA